MINKADTEPATPTKKPIIILRHSFCAALSGAQITDMWFSDGVRLWLSMGRDTVDVGGIILGFVYSDKRMLIRDKMLTLTNSNKKNTSVGTIKPGSIECSTVYEVECGMGVG